MLHAIAAAAPLQPVSRKKTTLPLPTRFSRRRRRITRAFVPVPEGFLETIPDLLRGAFLAIYEHCQGQPGEMEHRLLAKKLGKSMPTAERRVKALREGGWLGVRWRKKARCRNHPNLYTFPHQTGFVVLTSDGEIREKVLKPTTPAAAPPVSVNAKLYERVRVAEAHASRLQRENYDLRGEAAAHGRCRGGVQRGRNHALQQGLNASLGMYVPPTPEQEAQNARECAALVAEEAVKLGLDPETTTYEDVLAEWDRRRKERGLLR